MIIDSHQHVYYHSADPPKVIAEMDEFGITVTWLLTWYLPPNEDVPGTHRAFSPCNLRSDGTHAGAAFFVDGHGRTELSTGATKLLAP